MFSEAFLGAIATVGALWAWSERNRWLFPVVTKIWRWLLGVMPGARAQKNFEKILSQLIDGDGVGIGQRITELNGRQRHILAMLAIIDIKKKLLEDHVRVATFTTDASGNCVDVSQRYMRLTGMTMEELRGNGWKLGIAPGDLARWESEWAKAFAERRIFIGETLYINRLTGKLTPVRVTAYPVKSEGVLVCYVGTVRPIGKSFLEGGEAVDVEEEDNEADRAMETEELLGDV
jgi:PAS domain S-box-containing protein